VFFTVLCCSCPHFEKWSSLDLLSKCKSFYFCSCLVKRVNWTRLSLERLKGRFGSAPFSAKEAFVALNGELGYSRNAVRARRFSQKTLQKRRSHSLLERALSDSGNSSPQNRKTSNFQPFGMSRFTFNSLYWDFCSAS
jgi:hypothetical protein